MVSGQLAARRIHSQVGSRSVAGAVVALALVAAGCGGSDDDSPQDATPEEEVVQTVNSAFAAWADGDGGAACSLMTERGMRLAVEIAQGAQGPGQTGASTGCPAAIHESAELIAGEGIETVTPDQVQIRGSDTAGVLSEFRGELAVVRVGDRWLIDVPAFVD